MRRLLPSFVLICLAASACRPGVQQVAPSAVPPSGKVALIGVSGVTWEDLVSVNDSFLNELISRSVVANMSVRVTNRPADAYAALGAAQRAETDPSAGWAFNAAEQVENGTGRDLWERRNWLSARDRDANVLVATISHLRELNQGRAFDAVPGLLGQKVIEEGGRVAVVGNADHAIASLPSVLPTLKRMQSGNPPNTGIHREAALAVMDRLGLVTEGDVSRALLVEDPESPFGITTDANSLVVAFREAIASAELVIVETGDTSRANRYTEGMDPKTAERFRRLALEKVLTVQLPALLDEVGPDTLVAIFAATTPGGPQERGQLRPLILSGAGMTPGTAITRSTRRPGIVTVADLSATIARHLGLSHDRFGAGYPIRAGAFGSPDTKELVERNTRAVVHDAIRAPVSIAIILLHLVLYVLAVFRLRRGPLDPWIQILLLVALAFPLASFASALPMPMTITSAVLVITAAALVLGIASWTFSRSSEIAATVLLAATAIFFFVDLALGAQAQLDSVLGYTSVAAGRFFGLGNLGFALFSSSVLLLAAVIGDRWRREGKRTRRSFWSATPLVVLAIVWIGHPALGSDVGGVLTMIPALAVFVYALAGRRLGIGHLPAVVVVTLSIALIFGLLDLARPVEERTHLGDFLSEVAGDPLYLLLVIRRKLGLAISLTFATRWGLAVPGAIAVLVWLYRRARGQFRQMLEGRDALRAGLHALFVAAVVGSIVNDSGIAVAGMMLAVATPWALLTASTNEARISG